MRDLNYFKSHYSDTGLILSPYDDRDYKLKDNLPLKAMRITSDEYESPVFPFVYDQGETSMCCACAFNAVRYLQEDHAGINEPLSPAFTYGNRIPGENYEGMTLRSCCKKAREGSIPYDVLPGFYSVDEAIKKVKANEVKYLKMAAPLAINTFYSLTSRREIQIAIKECKAVLIGIPLTDSFFDCDNDGIVHYDPIKDRINYGGHAVALTGWRTRSDGLVEWRILNSWGTEWGDKGYCWLPQEYPWVDKAYCFTTNKIEYRFEDYKQMVNENRNNDILVNY